MKIQIDTELKTIHIPTSNTLDILEVLNELKSLEGYSLLTNMNNNLSTVPKVEKKSLLLENSIPECCKGCSNYKEGKVCHCTLPYTTNTGKNYPINTTTNLSTEDYLEMYGSTNKLISPQVKMTN